MKFFLDTANIDEINDAAESGLLDGITTNPSHVAKAGKPFIQLIKDICALVPGPVSAEVTASALDEMMKQAHTLAEIAPNVVVKVPLTADGLKAVKRLSEEGIKTNVTLCFSSVQALLAAKAGATYISPFIGRVDDLGTEGMETIREIRTIFDNYQFSTQILTASTRSTLHVRDAALAGSDVVTLPYAVFQKLVNNPLTDIGLKQFDDAWAKVPAELKGISHKKRPDGGAGAELFALLEQRVHRRRGAHEETMEVKVLNASGASGQSVAVPEKLAGTKPNMGLIHQVVIAELAGKRQGTHKTKRRDEVAGSGVKIRRQKGTGRSRQGDKRVPHMRGGGVVHGPNPRDYHHDTPRKMRQAAFRQVLKNRMEHERVFVLDNIALEAPRTKTIVALLKTIEMSDQRVLLLVAEGDTNLELSARNIPKITAQSAAQTNASDVLRAEALVCTRAAWDELMVRVDGAAQMEVAA